MSATIKCDGCGKEEPMAYRHGDYCKPSEWFQRSDKDGIQDACSRRCVDEVAERTGKSRVVLPL